MASRLGTIELIAPTYTPENYRTVSDAIGELPPIEDGVPNTQDLLHNAAKLSKTNIKRIRQSVQGGTWHDWDDVLG